MTSEDRKQTTIDWPSALQFTFSALGVLSLWGLAVGLLFSALMALFKEPGTPETTYSFLMVAGSLLSGALLLPSALYSGARLLGRTFQLPESWRGVLHKFSPGRLMWAFPVLLLLGYLVTLLKPVSWLLLPPLHAAAISLSIGWLLWLGLRGLGAAGSAQRAWGVFASGLLFGPLLAFVLEVLFLLGSGFIAMIYFASQPELLDLADDTVYRILGSTSNPDHILQAFSDLINTPGVLLVGMSYLSITVPLVEELVKPIGVWLLGERRRLTPVEGLAAGMISGAGFALYETLSLNAPQLPWASVIAMRTTTSALHIATTGLMGWALARTWQNGRYGQLVLSYLGVVAVHGIWNSSIYLASVSEILNSNPDLAAPPVIGPAWQWVGITVILLLTAGILLTIVQTNQKLRLQSAPEMVEYSAESVDEPADLNTEGDISR